MRERQLDEGVGMKEREGSVASDEDDGDERQGNEDARRHSVDGTTKLSNSE